MLHHKIQKRLELLERTLVFTSDNELHLTENNDSGFADLTLKLSNNCILFCKMENHKLQYFKNQKCADYIMYEYADGGWKVHIFEMKRTVKNDEWEKIKIQFHGAMQNMLAVAGFLGIDIDLEKVCVYTVYRNDRINNFANTAKLRYDMYKRKKCDLYDEYNDWNDEKVVINFIDKEKFYHYKIKLDVETGEGIYSI